MSGDPPATSSSDILPLESPRKHPKVNNLLSLSPPPKGNSLLFPVQSNTQSTMSSIASVAARRAFMRPTALRAPSRRFLATSSKLEEGGLDKAPKRDPELYV